MTSNKALAGRNGAEIPSVPAGVKVTTLENGLTIIVREDHSAPVVSAQAWCMAGSIHEGQQTDLLGYYREKYAPNNVFYVVAGDIKEEEAVGQIKEAYAKAKARAMPPMVLPVEPKQTAGREIIEEGPIELGHFHFAWHIPELSHPDVPVLDVLAAVLGNGRSSRLYQEIREKQGLVHSADAWTYSPGNAGLFGMSALLD